jgi:hypothetical protein
MKPQLRVLVAMFVVSMPVLGVVAGCNTSDNPKMAVAPPPPEPKAEEKKVPKVQGQEYGTSDRYKKAMEAAHKQSQ